MCVKSREVGKTDATRYCLCSVRFNSPIKHVDVFSLKVHISVHVANIILKAHPGPQGIFSGTPIAGLTMFTASLTTPLTL